MATMTTEQIEQKKQQLKQLAEEVKQLHDELVEAGAIELSENDLDKVAGGDAHVCFDLQRKYNQPVTSSSSGDQGDRERW